MIRKFAIAVLLVLGVALSGSVLAQAAPQPAPKAMTAAKTTTAKHHHAMKHHAMKHHAMKRHAMKRHAMKHHAKKHHKVHAMKHHKAHAKKMAMRSTGGNTGK